MGAPPLGGRSAETAGAGGSGAGAGGSDATAGTGAAGSAGAAGMPPAASGPKDGDPGKPIVAIDGIPCGPSQAGPAGGNFEIGGRKLIVDYPCEKHEGAHLTVILNLHGTLISGAPYSYQHADFRPTVSSTPTI